MNVPYADRSPEEFTHDFDLIRQAQALNREADALQQTLAGLLRDWARPLPSRERTAREYAIQLKREEAQRVLGQRYFNSRGERQRPASLGKLMPEAAP